jgi:hypothetical protein
MVETEHLRGGIRLGESVKQLMEQSVEPRYARIGPLIEGWATLLPVGLAGQSRIVDLESGELTIAAGAPAYAYELRLCSSELVEEIRQRCPRAKVRSIKVIVDG